MKKKKQKIKWLDIKRHLSKPVIVKFLDHASNAEPCYCVCVGFLAKITKKHIMVVSWDLPEDEPATRYHNMEYFSILKSAIEEIRPLRPSNKWG